MQHNVSSALLSLESLDELFAQAGHELSESIARTSSATKHLQFDVRRIVFHVRDDEGYRTVGVAAREQGQLLDRSMVVSASLWELISSMRSPLSLDVLTGIAVSPGDVSPTSTQQLNSLYFGTLGAGTINDLSARDTTHILALPLKLPLNELLGMITVEARCDEAIGKPIDWGDEIAGLQAFADLVAPLVDSYLRATRRVDQIAVTSTQDPPLLQVFARQDETVLLLGETGTGKSTTAKRLHELSGSARGPFCTFNMLGVSEELQLAHLFGWKRGAFTGATDDNVGLLHHAQGGTLFIDEIDKLGSSAQAGLLQLLENRRYQRLGESTEREADNVRFVVASNIDLRAAIETGEFRRDLYYRINVLPLKLSALREDRSQIVPWAKRLLDGIKLPSGERPRLDDACLARIQTETWPGNLRQLDNVLRRASAIAQVRGDFDGKTITEADLASAMTLEVATEKETSFLSQLEAAARLLLESTPSQITPVAIKNNPLFAMTWALAEHEFDRTHAATLVGKTHSLKTRNYQRELQREIDKLTQLYEAFGLPVPAFVSAAPTGRRSKSRTSE